MPSATSSATSLVHNYIDAKVRWDTDGGTEVWGIVRGVFHHPRMGGGAWDWTLQVKIEGARGFGAHVYPVNTITEVPLGKVTFP